MVQRGSPPRDEGCQACICLSVNCLSVKGCLHDRSQVYLCTLHVNCFGAGVSGKL